MWFFSFDFVYTVEYVDGFSHIEPSLHHWDEPYLTTVNDHFDGFWIQVVRNFLKIYFIFNSFFTLYIPFPAPPHPPSECSISHTSSPAYPISTWMPPPHLTFKLPGASSLLRVRCIISESTQTQKSSIVCWGPHISWCMLPGWWFSV